MLTYFVQDMDENVRGIHYFAFGEYADLWEGRMIAIGEDAKLWQARMSGKKMTVSYFACYGYAV
jgi:hypothetical protein